MISRGKLKSPFSHYFSLSASSNISLLLLTCFIRQALKGAGDQTQYHSHAKPKDRVLWRNSKLLSSPYRCPTPQQQKLHNLYLNCNKSSESSIFCPRSHGALARKTSRESISDWGSFCYTASQDSEKNRKCNFYILKCFYFEYFLYCSVRHIQS